MLAYGHCQEPEAKTVRHRHSQTRIAGYFFETSGRGKHIPSMTPDPAQGKELESSPLLPERAISKNHSYNLKILPEKLLDVLMGREPRGASPCLPFSLPAFHPLTDQRHPSLGPRHRLSAGTVPARPSRIHALRTFVDLLHLSSSVRILFRVKRKPNGNPPLLISQLSKPCAVLGLLAPECWLFYSKHLCSMA